VAGFTQTVHDALHGRDDDHRLLHCVTVKGEVPA